MKRPPELTLYVRQRSFTHALQPDRCMRVGRGSGVHIRVDDASVSREHLLLHVDEGGIAVEDLGSSNGTRIFKGGNRDQVVKLVAHERYALSAGDIVRIGNVPALLQQPASVPAPDNATMPPPSARERILADPEMQRIYELAERAAASDIGVLILGETGAGKELLATHVHDKSKRSRKAFMQINCAALAETLLESELFGHEKGAFTGANTMRTGLLESAEGGTVFLDEIGEMPLSTQAKLLRVLEEREIRRLGSSKKISIDVRFVSATNRNLEAEVAAGRFRGDLYYRISGIVVSVPPLRERQVEIEPLARHFLQDFCLRSGIATPEFTQRAISALLEYPWPGNVRELKNAMERAPFLSGGAPLTEEHVPREHAPEAFDDFDDDPFPDDEQTDIAYVPQELMREAVRGAREMRRSPTLPRGSMSGRPANAYRMPHPPAESDLLGTPTSNIPIPQGGSARPYSPFSSGANTSSGPPNAAGDANHPSGHPGLSGPPSKLTHGNSRGYSAELEREAVIQALDACSGNQTRAAEMLGVSRRTLINRIEALGLPRPRKRQRRS